MLAGTEEKLNALTREERYFQSAVEPYEHIVETVLMLQKSALLNNEQLGLLLTAISELCSMFLIMRMKMRGLSQIFSFSKVNDGGSALGSIVMKIKSFLSFVTLDWGFIEVSCLMVMVIAFKTKYLLWKELC